jgi:hypothetical protein
MYLCLVIYKNQVKQPKIRYIMSIIVIVLIITCLFLAYFLIICDNFRLILIRIYALLMLLHSHRLQQVATSFTTAVSHYGNPATATEGPVATR